ncbi:flagellar protein FlgJ [Sphingomonas palmae]|uniref:Flagellar protein FlgJ n=1 Tax=Sphingomonas palmae TaxID=1855283 RepID=A0A1H7RHH9_9SPHN|nr:rod-binding protein [Sphingomonas palmae]SEL59274.1 flagellar protein FlgJ [Sphingomonas palmae]
MTDTPNIAGATASLTPTSATGTFARANTKENLAKAGQQFESVFTGMMLKSMRQAKLADPLFDSKALDTFRDMQDQKTVQSMAEHTPLGIGRAMTEFLGRGQPNLNEGGGKPAE